MGQPPARVWWGLGHRVGSHGGNAFASCALGLAVASLVLSSTAFIVAYATYEGRSIREGTRIPHFVEDLDDAQLTWVQSNDSLDSRTFTVIYIEPLVPEAPLPPGLDEWPEPGRYLASPRVMELSHEEPIGQRFGVFDGVIASQGLVSPTEMLVYARPEAGSQAPSRALGVSGFGIEDPPLGIGLIGEALWAQPMSKFLSLMSFFLIAPCLLLVAASSRLRLPERQRRSASLAMLGARFRIRARFDIASIVRPMLWGTVSAAVVIGLALIGDLPLPGTGYVLQAEDLRRHIGGIVLSSLISLGVFIAAFVFASRARFGATTTKPVPTSRPPRGVLAALAMLSAPAATGLLLLVRKTDGVAWSLNLYLVALVITLLTLSRLVGWLTFQVAHSLRQNGQRADSPGAMVAGASLMRDQRPVVRLGTAIATIMILAAQAQSLNAMAGQDVLREIAIRQELSGEYAEVAIDPNDLGYASSMIAKAEGVPGTAVIVVESRISNQPGIAMDHTIWGQPAALETWSLPPGGSLESIVALPRMDYLALGRYISLNESAAIEPTRFSPGEASDTNFAGYVVYIKSADGSPLPLNDLKSAVRSVAYPVAVGYAGESSYLGAWMGQHQGRWFGWFATIGTALLTVALLAAGSDDVMRSARKLAPTAALFGARRVTAGYAAWRVGIPTALGVGIGAVIAFMLTSPLTIIADVPAPIGAVGSTAVAAVLVSLFLWWLVTKEARRLSRRWDGRTMSSR